ncbi:MAG: hypothetical protein WCP98_18000 [Actinomycetes bacterium]
MVSLSRQPGHGAVWHTAVRVTLTGADGPQGSGVKRIEYRQFAASGRSHGVSRRIHHTPLVLKADNGAHSCACRSIDRVGNVGEVERFTVRIHKTR